MSKQPVLCSFATAKFVGNMNFTLLFVIFCLRKAEADMSLVIDVFKSKNIKSALLFRCGSSTTYEITVLKQFKKYGIFTQTYNADFNVSYEIPTAYSKVGIYLNTSCESWSRIFISNLSKLKYYHQFLWCIFAKNFRATTNILMKYPITIDSDVTIFTKSGNIFVLYEIYNTGINKKSYFVIRNTGVWNETLVLNKNTNRNDFKGIVLKCGVVLMENVTDSMSEHFLTQMSLYMADPVHRFKYFKLLSHLQELFNFSCKIVRTNSWGYQRNNSFDGLVGLLQRKEIELGAAPVFYRTERAEVVDYTAQIWPAKPYLILRQPKYSGSFYSLYTRPLTKTVWLCIFVVLTIAGVILGVMLKMNILKAIGDEEDTSPSLALLFIFGAVSQQGMSVNKKSTSVKMVIFVTFIFTLTLYQYYNATVVSTLLRVPLKVIDSLSDLVKSDLRAGADDNLYNRDFFKHTTDPLAIKLYHKKIVHGSRSNYLTPEHGMALVKEGGFAFLVDASTAYHIMRKKFSEREICDTTEVSLYPPQSIGSIAQKGSPYKEFLALGTSKMLESGVMHRLKAMWDSPRPPCVRSPDTSVFSVTIYEFSMALVVLLLGVLTSALVLLCEIFTYRIPREVERTRKRRKMKTKKVIEFQH